jgi:para-nitrobenzyl esterase
VLPQTPLQLLATHPAVPLLMGSNTTEDSSNYYDNKTGTIAQLSHQDWVNESQAVVGADNAAAARNLFPASDYNAPVWQAVALDTDADNTCWVRQYLRAAQSPAIWRYTYAHPYENDPVQGPFRSSHVYEEPLLWGAPVVYFIQHTNTPAEDTLSDQLTSFWTNFAKTGNPNGAGLPTWPQYTGASGSEPTLQIDDTMTTLNKFQDAQCNFSIL